MKRLPLRILWFYLAALFPAVAASAAPVDDETIRFVDLTDDFDSFWERSRAMEPAARIAGFKSEFARLIPGFYDPARVGDDPAAYDRQIGNALARYADQREGVREVSRRLAELFGPARSSFEAEFGGFDRPQTIYLLHSLGEMDGGTRTLPEGLVLIFGADMIARYHLSHRIQPFFHHELFHVRHEPAFGDCSEKVWCSLWIEGLASYAAARLNPDATDAELLLTIPEPIPPSVDLHRQEAVCAVVARLDSTGRDDLRALFSFSRMNQRLPPRFGYYIGYLAVAELGRDRSLQQLTALSQREVRPLLEAGLRSLAHCDG